MSRTINETLLLERPLIESEIKICLNEKFGIDPKEVTFHEGDRSIYGAAPLGDFTMYVYRGLVDFKIKILDPEEMTVVVEWGDTLPIAIARTKQKIQELQLKLQEIL